MKKKGNLKKEGYRKLIAHYAEKTLEQTLKDLFPELEIKNLELLYFSTHNVCYLNVIIQEKLIVNKTNKIK